MQIDAARAQVSRVAVRAGTLAEAGPELVELLQAAVGGDGATVTVVDGDQIRYVAACGRAHSLHGECRPLMNSFTGDVVVEQRPRLFDPIVQRPASRGRAAVSDFRSGIVAPVVVRGVTIGTVGVVAIDPGTFGYSARDDLARLAETIADGLELAAG